LPEILRPFEWNEKFCAVMEFLRLSCSQRAPSLRHCSAICKLLSRLGGVMVSVLAIGPQCTRVQTRPKRLSFEGVKFRSTPSFGGEVKPAAQVVIFYGM
jgi:hypothetical protein